MGRNRITFKIISVSIYVFPRSISRQDQNGVQGRYSQNIRLKDVTITYQQNPAQVLTYGDETVGDGYRSAF